ncbi:MAG: FAD-dependent oxidoreductase [Anaerolineae bacterium]|jgi:D-amino-acid dehydrogenase|nr:FAD-dependent oxidoreductase [Anaerolineae bacterium]MBT7989770.1 FAD-dependent oxidoreductase [Anaerolineae bacterium]
MKKEKDIIVIGGGIIGLSVAYYLSRQGRSVTLIEKKDEVGVGSSYGNAGWIANGFSIPMAAPGIPLQGMKWLFDPTSPFYIKPRLDFDLFRWLWKFIGACNEKDLRASYAILLSLGQGSFDLFDEIFSQEDVDFGYESKGRLSLFTSKKSFEKSMADVAFVREYGVDVSLLDVDGVREIEPNISASVKHGFYSKDYAHLDPGRFTQEMARLAESRGVEIMKGVSVRGFEITAGQISSVETTQGTFIPDQVVLAAGAWSALLARKLKIKLPIQPAKGYSLTYKCPPELLPQLPISLVERKAAATPMGERVRFASTLELAGFDSTINQPRVDAIRRSAKEYLSGTEALAEEEVWSGFRAATPDDLPIIGRSDKYENLIFATGHGTLGMTYSLITGKLVSQIIAGEEASIDLKPLRAERF